MQRLLKVSFVFSYHLEIANDGSYRPLTGYNHHVHPKPHPSFDKMPETIDKPEMLPGKPSKIGLFKEDVDTFQRKPFYASSPVTVRLKTFWGNHWYFVMLLLRLSINRLFSNYLY